MKSRTKQGLLVLARVREFLAANEVMTAFGPITKHVEGLSAVFGRLSSFATSQDASTRAVSAGTRTAHGLARSLRFGYMRPVSRLGRTLFPNDPSIRRALRMPKADDYVGLIASGNAMAEIVSAHEDRFVTAGFAEDFVERVRQAAADLEKALLARSDHQANRAAATAGLEEEMARGRDLVRLLDALLVHQWADAPDRLAKWRSLSRFIRRVPPEVEVAGAPVSTPVSQEPVRPEAGGNEGVKAPTPGGGVKAPTSADAKPLAVTPASPAVQPTAIGDAVVKAA